MRPLLTYLFLTFFISSFAQDVVQKTIIWTKYEGNEKVEFIKEGDHEYILRTSLEVLQQMNQPSAPAATSNSYTAYSYTPEPKVIPYQTDDVVRARIVPVTVSMGLQYNSYVKREIDLFLRHAPTLEALIGRSKHFLPDIERQFAMNGMPLYLKYIPVIESSFKISNRSRAGANGLWHFMPSTARLYGMRVNSTIDERFNPSIATATAIKYLNYLYDEFQDWELVLAAYNGGPGRVQRAIKKSGIQDPTFWQIRHLLPRETRRYVARFTAAAYVMENYHFMGIGPDPYAMEEARLEDDLWRINNYKVAHKGSPKSAAGTSAVPANSSKLTYTVKSGDNIGFIAEWYDVRASQVRGWNGIKGNMIRAGQKLKIYVPATKQHIYADIDRLTFAQKQGPTSKSSNKQLLAQNKASAYSTYTMKSGDTLWDISRKTGVSVEQIKKLNNITNTKKLKPGMVLKLKSKS